MILALYFSLHKIPHPHLLIHVASTHKYLVAMTWSQPVVLAYWNPGQPNRILHFQCSRIHHVGIVVLASLFFAINEDLDVGQGSSFGSDLQCERHSLARILSLIPMHLYPIPTHTPMHYTHHLCYLLGKKCKYSQIYHEVGPNSIECSLHCILLLTRYFHYTPSNWPLTLPTSLTHSLYSTQFGLTLYCANNLNWQIAIQ